MPKTKKLRVFVCHTYEDIARARELYRYLKKHPIQPWLAAEDLIPGQEWESEIPKALETSDVIIICLSKNSVDKEGYIQKEIKFALDKALNMPKGRIFLIPARFEDCDVPRLLSSYQWVNFYEEGGYEKLLLSLIARAEQIGALSPLEENNLIDEKLINRDNEEKNIREAEERVRKYKDDQEKRVGKENIRKENIQNLFKDQQESPILKQDSSQVAIKKSLKIPKTSSVTTPIDNDSRIVHETAPETQGAKKERKASSSINRMLVSCAVHIAILFFGWVIDQWMGILLIAPPILIIYYFYLYRLAAVLVPTSNPDDRTERWKRYLIFVTYTWGIQFPMYVVDGHAWKKLKARIPGNFTRDLPVPGLIWTRSHQVVAITSGMKFKRLDGPGVVFTGKMERPFQVFDLRLQLRTNEIDVVSKDGISFKARVFTAFRLDPEAWDKETYEKMRRTNPILRGADKPTHTLGSFPFSHQRIQATLGVTSTKAALGDQLIYWDQWAVNIVEKTARKVLSQKNLDELWRPARDEKYANALDGIAKEIKEEAFPVLRSAGVLVFAARVVNFNFPGEPGQVDDISKQQIATWGSEWDGKSSKILSEAQAESEYAQQEARAYGQSMLLDAIAQGLQKAQKMHPDLPRYIIAMRFLSALQEYNQAQSVEKDTDDIRAYNTKLEGQLFPNSGKEKKS